MQIAAGIGSLTHPPSSTLPPTASIQREQSSITHKCCWTALKCWLAGLLSIGHQPLLAESGILEQPRGGGRGVVYTLKERRGLCF